MYRGADPFNNAGDFVQAQMFGGLRSSHMQLKRDADLEKLRFIIGLSYLFRERFQTWQIVFVYQPERPLKSAS